MEAVQIYAYATSAWLSLQALPLLITPKLIVTMLKSEPTATTYIETYFARVAGSALLFLGLISLVLTGVLPVADQPSASDTPAPSPYTKSAISVTTVYHAAATVHAYTTFMSQRSAPLALGATASGVLAAAGLWCVLFAGGGHISRRTGADKRTSGWPFTNAEAQKRKAGKRRE